MLDTRFPRPVGDIGNANTFDFPVLTEIVPGASAQRVVRQKGSATIDEFVAAGRRLIERGAIGITTSCGFLSLFQHQMSQRLPVPVALSSLLQVPWVETLLPAGKRCGVLTIDADALGPGHLQAAGARADTPIAGLPRGGVLQHAIFADQLQFDRSAAQHELVEAARGLCRACPEVAAVVLECTNLPPYRNALHAAIGMPVFDAGTLIEWFWRGLAPMAGAAANIAESRR